jgi:peptidoglycan hydrolase-like protein with peptidoglycan-binding domain
VVVVGASPVTGSVRTEGGRLIGSRYLLDLADVCRRTGYPVIEVGGGRSQQGPQWQYRARGSGGYNSGLPNHIMVHHTASSEASDGWPDVNYCTFASSVKPVSNLYIARNGDIYVLAGGATNTNGSGKDPCGISPDNQMNTAAIAIEAGNNGRGETWPDPQLDSYVALVRELCHAYGIGNAQVHGHAEYAPSRKIDPAGPPRYAQGSATWNMGLFRSDVAGSVPPQPPPDGGNQDWVTWVMDNQPVLRRGSTGINVKRMQHLLAATGHMDPGNVSNYDGNFGSGTEAALNRFKAEAGGAQDGTCDSWTWGALMHTVDGIPDIAKGARGDDVERMQHLLAANGYMDEGNKSNYDGVWGDGTDKAKARFDNDHGLAPSPPTDCGAKSWESLLNGWVW